MHMILLVEDEPLIALAEKTTLEANGYAVATAQNGNAAIEAARAHDDIDLVLMDIDLGSGMDGAETAKAILAVRNLPIVFLTCHTGQDVVERVQSISNYGYVVKSSGEFVLLESIRMALRLFEANAALARRKEFIETVLDVIPVGLATTDLESNTSEYLNREFERIYGWPFEVISSVDRFFEAVYPDPEYREQIQSKVMADIAAGDPGKMIWDNVRITTREGEERIIRAQNIPIPGQKLMVSTVMDRTEQKLAMDALRASEQELQKQIQEKNTLLRETHHRIKNNIASVASLLLLQASDMDEPAARQALYEAITRVRSMQKLYDTMLLRDTDGSVMLDEYVSTIVELVAELFDGTKSTDIRAELDSCTVEVKDAFSIGIIVNELLTNIMKYAFLEQTEKMVSVSLKREDGGNVLCIRDNGQGFQDQHLPDATEGFGLSLVRMLCEHLGADLRLYNDDGAVAEVRFPCNPPA
ncbi:MAG: response regulator [Spirochaetaceae bacterium]|nr:MAG: response regulator [Spirochaetaceae bacterium]